MQMNLDPVVLSLALWPNNSCHAQWPLVLTQRQLDQVLKRTRIYHHIPCLQLQSQQQRPDHRCAQDGQHRAALWSGLMEPDLDDEQRTGAVICQPAVWDTF